MMMSGKDFLNSHVFELAAKGVFRLGRWEDVTSSVQNVKIIFIFFKRGHHYSADAAVHYSS